MTEWNHNTFYHKSILRNLPEERQTALDIGSGLGLFTYKLSSNFLRVSSLEPDTGSVNIIKKVCEPLSNVEIINSSLEEFDFGNKKYDFITSIASIHHMDFSKALTQMTRLLKPGGKLVVLGLYKESSIVDLLISIISIIPNFVMNLIFNKKSDNNKMIVTHPQMTIKEIKKHSKDILGNYQFKRHLFWRYSIIYHRDNLPNM